MGEAIRAFAYHTWISVEGDWFFSTLIALVLYGAYQYLLDLSVTRKGMALLRGVATHAAVAGGSLSISAATAFWLLLGLLRRQAPAEERLGLATIGYAVFLGIFQGLLFLFVNLFRAEARRSFSQQVVLSAGRLNTVLVILCSWFLFGELDAVQDSTILGFGLVAMSVWLLREGGVDAGGSGGAPADEAETAKPVDFRSTSGLVLSVVVSAGILVLAKYAVGPSRIDIALFMFFSNTATFLGAFLFMALEVRRAARSESGPGLSPESGRIIWDQFRRGCALGLVNLIGYACLLRALSVGDASIVIPIHSLYIVIPAGLAAVAQGRKLSERSTLGVIVSLLAVVALRE
jgi:uncharacterized membrane protein